MSDEKRTLLIIDDDPGLQKQLKWCFADFNTYTAGDRESGLAILKQNKPPIVLLDLGLPPDPANASEGLAALEQILTIEPSTKVIVVTGNDDKEVALKAIASGAYDFYQKPVDADVLSLIVDRAYRLYLLELENKKLLDGNSQTAINGIIFSSDIMRKVCHTIEKVAPTDVTVLLLGESGTGKELLARALHEQGVRKDEAFIAINCAAIPENLLESELFGYEKGAFTGAARQTRGKIEYAEKGTLFLDEIGDLPAALQAKLLRFIQERVIERVGGREEIAVDVRIVCATHQDLTQKIENGEFREDLYYRISEISIDIPPLRERPGDAVMLVRHFLKQGQLNQAKAKRLSEVAISAIEKYDWPGNARELENKVKRALILSESDRIEAVDLQLIAENGGNKDLFDLKTIRDKAEYDALERALNFSENKLTRTAKLLGVSRPTLYDLLNKHGLK